MKIWGILNITPDSFSDGGQNLSLEKAIQKVKDMIAAGVEVVDIGAESTRPGATPLNWRNEWDRLKEILPAISQECRANNVLVSLDSYKPNTVSKALPYIDIINDVSGLTSKEMIAVVRESSLPTVLMHSLSVPANASITIDPKVDVIKTVLNWFDHQVSYLIDNNVAQNQIIIDPGIGFGKTQKQSKTILANIKRFQEFGLPILIGHSRKKFLRQNITEITNTEVDWNTALLSGYLATKGVDYIRVHNVALNLALIDLYSCLVSDANNSSSGLVSYVQNYFELEVIN